MDLMDLNEMQTPALILDRRIMDRNIDRMAVNAERLGVPLRPHAKTPKSLPVVQQLLKRNAQGICVSTLKEAEYFAAGGIDDIFYAVALAPDKVERAAKLAAQGVKLLCLIDSLDAAVAIGDRATTCGAALHFLIEIDVDHYRSGIAPRSEEFLTLAAFLHAHEWLGLAGIMSYGGASYGSADPSEAAALAGRHRKALLDAKARLLRHGMPCDTVSFGSTPAVLHAEHLNGVTECRCGIYVFQDLMQAGIGACDLGDIAVSVLTSVIGHRRTLNGFIVDAGGMALSKDRSTQGKAFDAGYGLVCDAISGAVIEKLFVEAVSQELGLVTTLDGSPVDLKAFPIGRKLRVLPNHADMTAAAYPAYHVVDGSAAVTDIWDRVNHW